MSDLYVSKIEKQIRDWKQRVNRYESLRDSFSEPYKKHVNEIKIKGLAVLIVNSTNIAKSMKEQLNKSSTNRA